MVRRPLAAQRGSCPPFSPVVESRPRPASFGLDSQREYLGQLAQLVEHGTENAGVPGSSPGLPISIDPGQSRGARAVKKRSIAGSLSQVELLCKIIL